MVVFATDGYITGTYNSVLKYKKYSDHIEISDCNELVTNIEIPSKFDELPVTKIDNGAFSNCENLTEIIIPDSVTSIGDSAFSYCENLTEIIIPNNVTNIGKSVFTKCSNLKEIIVSENNPNYYSADGVLFNKEKARLIQYPIGNIETKYIIPDSVTSIGNSAFSNCENLTEIIIPDSLTKIGGQAFSGTSWIKTKQKESPLVIVNEILIDGNSCKGDIIIPYGITSIGESAFLTLL